jgi:aminopeptidase N
MNDKNANKKPTTFKLQFADTSNPATDKQIDYLRSFENFISKLSKHQLHKRLDKALASQMIDLLKEGEVVHLNNYTSV